MSTNQSDRAMEKNELKQSEVVFNSEHHTYTLEGKNLSGVTPIVHWLFPETYKGIPDCVLSAAADYGTMVHLKCEMYDSMGICNDDVVEAYKRIMTEAGLKVSVSEYLVSDNQFIASCIDKVCEDDSLCDIKTTSKVHLLNVQVQLSIYAWLYEMQTGRKANKLYLVWLPKPRYGKPKVQELKRIPSEWCDEAVRCYIEGQTPDKCVAALTAMGFTEEEMKKRVEGGIPDEWESVIDELITVKKQIDFYSEREKEIKASLQTAMSSRGEDKWANDLIQISRRAASERVSIDTKALKEQQPDIYESFKKVTKVAESLTYKVL